MKYIIECDIESADTILTLHLCVNTTEAAMLYTIKVIDTLLKHLAINDIIERYKVYEVDN